MKLALRYLAYLAFAIFTPIFWISFAWIVTGSVPLGDRVCDFEPQGCPEPPVFVQAFGVIAIFLALPLTALAFVLFRKLVRRLLQIDGP